MAKCALPAEAGMELDTGHCDINIFICIYKCISICIHANMCIGIYLLNVAPAAAA